MISIYELQNSYMTQGLYSFSEARHKMRQKEQSEVQMERNKSETIEQGVQWFTDLRTRARQQEHNKTIREQ